MIPAAAVILAMIVQVVVVNRLPLPGGAGPDLVLLVVIAYAVARGAQAGAVLGFGAGLAVDVLPPADHVIGQYALVLCLIGFLAGRAVERTSAALVPAVVVSVLAAPLIAAGVAALLGDPRITWPHLVSVLPAILVYNLLAAPLVVAGTGRVLSKQREQASRRARRSSWSRT
jgi:rod shape-determining protein MreD